jgi:hypothetical protein
MYRPEDIEKIEKHIDRIKNDVAREYRMNYEPTLNEITKVYNVIINYLKENKKIVYGGFAQNMLIKNKNPKDSFYKEIDGVFYNWPDVADIEFYSTDPIEDVVKLTEKLYTYKFKHIIGKEGVHPETYKIFVNLINYCDISYMAPNIYDNLPIINVDGILCCEPHFMMCDAYRVMTDPLTSYWRLDKSINRFQKIIKYYPLDMSLLDKKYEFKSLANIIKIIRKQILHNSKLIIIGFYAFNYYVKKSMKKYIIKDVSYYEAISTNFDKDKIEILKKLNHYFNSKITVKEFYPFFMFFDKRIEFYYDGNLIFKLYGNNERCTVYKHSEKKHCYFGTYNLVFMYLLFNYYYFIIYKDIFNVNLFKSLIAKLNYIRNNYLNKRNITVIDTSPFQDFTFKCIGIPLDPLRSSLINNNNNDKNLFIYKPSGNIKKLDSIKFINKSGSQI